MRKSFLAFCTAVFCMAVSAGTAFAAPADGTAEDVSGDTPSEALDYIRDYGFEWAPNVMTVIGAIFALVLTFGLIRMGLARVRGAMRA